MRLRILQCSFEQMIDGTNSFTQLPVRYKHAKAVCLQLGVNLTLYGTRSVRNYTEDLFGPERLIFHYPLPNAPQWPVANCFLCRRSNPTNFSP